jgi:hypothetical protein
MSKLTLDEAIKHCLEVAENNEQFASGKWIGSEGEANRRECLQCAADHRQLAEWLTELKEARKLLTATKYKVKHEEWDMHGEHYIGDYALCPNCNKCFTNIYNGKAAPVVTFCPDCGQKIDWNE